MHKRLKKGAGNEKWNIAFSPPQLASRRVCKMLFCTSTLFFSFLYINWSIITRDCVKTMSFGPFMSSPANFSCVSDLIGLCWYSKLGHLYECLKNGGHFLVAKIGIIQDVFRLGMWPINSFHSTNFSLGPD